MEKTCSACKELLSIESFNLEKKGKFGRRGNCKKCYYAAKKKYRQNPNNRQKLLKRGIDYYKDPINKERKRKYDRERLQKPEIKNSNRIYRKQYESKRRHTDILFKMKRNLRTRLCRALESNQKSGSAIKDLGCSIEQLKVHLESKFKPDMSWNNHGIHGWHIDHIIPLASFDLTDRDQLLIACNFSNLQPLWAKENITKGKK